MPGTLGGVGDMASECWLEIHFVNVGYGDCTIIALFEAVQPQNATAPVEMQRETMLIDCGAHSSHVLSYGRNFGLLDKTNNFNHFVLTHPHDDHTNIPKETSYDRIWMVDPNLMPRSHKIDATTLLSRVPKHRQMILFQNRASQSPDALAFMRSQVCFELICGGGFVNTDSGFEWVCDSNKGSPNICSLGFILRFGDFTFYSAGDLTTDLDAKVAKYIEKTHPQGIDLCKANHHGTRSHAHNGNAILNALNPQITYVPSWDAMGIPDKPFIDACIGADPSIKNKSLVYIGNIRTLHFQNMTPLHRNKILNCTTSKDCRISYPQPRMESVHNYGGLSFVVTVRHPDSTMVTTELVKKRVNSFHKPPLSYGASKHYCAEPLVLASCMPRKARSAQSVLPRINAYDISLCERDDLARNVTILNRDSAAINDILNTYPSFGKKNIYSPFSVNKYDTPNFPHELHVHIYRYLEKLKADENLKYLPVVSLVMDKARSPYKNSKLGSQISDVILKGARVYEYFREEAAFGGKVVYLPKYESEPCLTDLWFLEKPLQKWHLVGISEAMLYAATMFFLDFVLAPLLTCLGIDGAKARAISRDEARYLFVTNSYQKNPPVKMLNNRIFFGMGGSYSIESVLEMEYINFYIKEFVIKRRRKGVVPIFDFESVKNAFWTCREGIQTLYAISAINFNAHTAMASMMRANLLTPDVARIVWSEFGTAVYPCVPKLSDIEDAPKKQQKTEMIDS